MISSGIECLFIRVNGDEKQGEKWSTIISWSANENEFG